MCASCAPGQIHVDQSVGAPGPGGPPVQTLPTTGPARFVALRSRDCRNYLGGTLLSMMADNVEHVITYWVLWQTFHSPALAGFQVISHFVPFLLFSVYFGGLADRFDCRRVIQVAQVMFMAVSVAWGLLFLTGALQIWNACVLLVIHGLAGTLWGPAEQLMLHDFVGDDELPSAVRLNATARSLGILLGPVVGSALLLGLGPTAGIFINVLIYLPLTVFLARTAFTGHTRDAGIVRARMSALEALRVLREVADNPVLVGMIALAGLASFFIGVALQSTMPIFAASFGAGVAGAAYGVLLFANGLGGVLGGLLLEATGRIQPTLRAAGISTLLFGASTLAFAVTDNYQVALVLLVLGGAANLAAMSIGQTAVQLLAPPDKRGRVIGLYGVSANGLRFGSGITVGLLGGLIGVHWSLGLSSAALCVGTLLVGLYTRRAAAGPRRLAA
jgi:MFS family permease